ncbi:MAG: NAD(+)/NADH kinase [Traorella sp.]
MNKFCVIFKNDDKSEMIANLMSQELKNNHWINDSQNPELVICVGGDGTFLHAIHEQINNIQNCCFLAIHTGTLGFFTDYTSEEVNECIQDILTKEPHIKNKYLLEIEYKNQKYYAVNEMRIENVVRTQLIKVKIDGEDFETFRGTGMCISTQAGSTAYNRSLKGAVLEEGLELLQLNEITGIHHQKYRSLGVPYIMNKNRVIEFESDTFDGAILLYDHKHFNLSNSDKIKIRMSDSFIKIAEYKKINYIDRLKDLY